MRVAVIVGATVLGGLIGLARADAGSADHHATSLYASTVDGPSAGVILNSYATLLASESFRDQLATVTGEELDETSLVISVPDSTGLISATVRAPSPEQVLGISEQILPTFQVLAVETGPEVDPSEALIDVFGGPSAPEQDVPSRIWPLFAGAIAGMALGILVVVLWPSGRPRGVSGLGPAEEASGIAFRAAIPDLHDSDRSTRVNPHDAAYALLRAGTDRWWRQPVEFVLIVPTERDRRVLDLALDLAAVALQGGNRALLVDADLERGGLSHHVDRGDRLGVTDTRVSGGRIEATITTVGDVHRTPLPFLARGTGSTDATSAVIAPLITQLDEFDVAIVVAPPFDEHAPLAELLEVADGVLVTAIAGRTTEDELTVLGDLLRSMAVAERSVGALLGAQRLSLNLELEPHEAVSIA